jgi:CHORD
MRGRKVFFSYDGAQVGKHVNVLTPICIGWKCCKPRVLTFDEFLNIPPCTTGKHSTVDDTPQEEPKKVDSSLPAAATEAPVPVTLPIATTASAAPIPTPTSNTAAAAPPPEPESDDPSLSIPANATCRRKGCNATYSPDVSRDDEECTYHPGQPVFHEGSKGWSCCKKRVLEFDEFMKIPGCANKKRHLFVGKGKAAGEEKIDDVR